MDARLRALNRYGLGARIGEGGTLSGPEAWLTAQLRDGAGVVEGGVSLAEATAALTRLREARRSQDPDVQGEARRTVGRIISAEVDLLLDTRIRTGTPFVERLVAFWSNHLCVSAAKAPAVAILAGHYERTVIRPHVLGRFADMVLASARHPAMLLYLDNAQSIGPGSPAGRRAGRGLNENYARELLELHTVGVDGGYDQEDVIALAGILTGWTLAGLGPAARPGERPGFAFRRALHEPGAKTLMGRRYGPAGVREGEAAIRDLCAHPATARFVAGKLVTHFIADDPPAAAVERVAAVFTETGGDLRAIASSLVSLEAAWDPENIKFRSPLDWLTAIFRALHAKDAPRELGPVLRQLRQPVWSPPSPKGYGDAARDWADPDSLMNRAELGRTVAARALDGGGLDPRRLLEVVDVDGADPLHVMLSDTSMPAPERLALAIAGPAFQWR